MRRSAGRITDAAAAKLAQSPTTCGTLPVSGAKAALPAADATTKTTERIIVGSDLRVCREKKSATALVFWGNLFSQDSSATKQTGTPTLATGTPPQNP
jgi:hypothetical protein